MKRLRELAKESSILPSYLDVWGKTRVASQATLLRLLESRGIGVGSDRDVAREIERIRVERQSRVVEPVVVHFADSPARPSFRARLDEESIPAVVETEEGARIDTALRREGARFTIDCTLEHGYYVVRFAGVESFLIVAPRCGYVPEQQRAWGVFVPAYAAWREGSCGVGDVRDLETMARSFGELGASCLATLPLGPTFLQPEYSEVSPYAAVSRMFWNELYIDLEAVPELHESERARSLYESSAFRSRIDTLTAGPLVDHVSAMAAKREVLEAIVTDAPVRNAVERRLDRIAHDRRAIEYARFRSTHERERRGWQQWNGNELDPLTTSASRFYLYAQAIIREQIERLGRETSLYLDFPLGTHASGFDTFRFREDFLMGSSAGAPPDHSYSSGQSWGFPPLDPEAIRRSRYESVRASVRHHLSAASMLRIDHVMGLHRLYVVPDGLPPSEGAYVRYHASEMIAILTLESQRAKAVIIGEDLGTVPAYVRKSIDRHRFRRLFVVQRRLQQKMPDPPGDPVENMVASLNTHDMYPFAAYWGALDIPDRKDVGLLDDETAPGERKKREEAIARLIGFLGRRKCAPADEEADSVMDATLQFLGRSDAAVVLVNVEDLWNETLPQNIPTTTHQRPNWRRRLKFAADRIITDSRIRRRLDVLDASRKKRKRND